MQFFKLVAITASLALAQAKIGFTSAPAGTIAAGSPVKLSWTGGSGAPVTITLKQGDPSDLATVAIITGDATGTSFTWTPSSSLPDADDYALEISEGVGLDSTNYTGEFAISGGAPAVATTSGVTATGSYTGTVTVTSTNATQTVAHTVYATAGTGTGTGISVARNTTFVLASIKTASATNTGGLSAGPVTTTAHASGTTSATSSSSSGVAGQVGAQVGAAGMALLAAVAFL